MALLNKPSQGIVQTSIPPPLKDVNSISPSFVQQGSASRYISVVIWISFLPMDILSGDTSPSATSFFCQRLPLSSGVIFPSPLESRSIRRKTISVPSGDHVPCPSRVSPQVTGYTTRPIPLMTSGLFASIRNRSPSGWIRKDVKSFSLFLHQDL